MSSVSENAKSMGSTTADDSGASLPSLSASKSMMESTVIMSVSLEDTNGSVSGSRTLDATISSGTLDATSGETSNEGSSGSTLPGVSGSTVSSRMSPKKEKKTPLT